MKRDMDLIRSILIGTEQLPHGEIVELEIDGFTPDEISYHVMLLHEAGYLIGHAAHVWHVERLTWEGHEFLEASRDDTRWNKAKEIVKEKGGGLAVDVLKQVLLQLMNTSVMAALHSATH